MGTTPIGGTGANSGTGTTLSQSISPPAGSAAGDLAILVGNIGAGIAITMGAPGSWTQLVAPSALASGTGQLGVWCKFLTGNGSTTGDWAANAIFITASSARAISVGLTVIRGAGFPVTTSINGATGTTSLTSGAVTPANADSLLLAVNTGSGNTTGSTITQTTPAGYTEQVDTCNTRASVSRQFVGMHTKQLSGQAGVSQSAATATASPGNTDYQAVHLVISPNPVSAAPSDTAGGTDTVTRATSLPRSLADTAAGTDTVTRTSSRPRATSDTAAGTDAVTRTTADARATADTAAATDSVSASLTSGGPLARSTSDSAPATDTVARSSTRARGVSDTGAGTDTLARVIHLTRAVTDTAGGHDTVTAVDPDAGSTGTIAALWWDGVAEQPGTLEGWWDGDTVQPAVLEGWWDGAAVQPVA